MNLIFTVRTSVGTVIYWFGPTDHCITCGQLTKLYWAFSNYHDEDRPKCVCSPCELKDWLQCSDPSGGPIFERKLKALLEQCPEEAFEL
ncbi:MAG TPA: hypothetical protein VNX68_04460 [Nitrosopumilaceae archaeon]|jgi:hypothetical protein|nr:hypothetical protein [Nitrosopumilaceae archaeon]